MRAIKFSDAKSNLKNLLDQVTGNAEHIVVTRPDAEDVVIMSSVQFNSLMETVHLMKHPANAAHLSKSIKQYRNN